MSLAAAELPLSPQKSLLEVRSVRLGIERCGVEGGFGRKAMSSWNSGRIIGQKPPLQPKEVWAIRTRLQMWCGARPGAVQSRCSRVVERRASSIGLDPKRYGTHSMSRAKAAHIYKEDRQPARRPAFARPQELEHRAAPRNRGGRRPGHF